MRAEEGAIAKGDITHIGVLNAIADFDRMGRSAFLDRYGLDGVRGYFIVRPRGAALRLQGDSSGRA